MYAKIEPTGCTVRNGMCQVRLSFFLEAGDYGYDKHYLLLPVIPEGGYTGKVDEMGSPVDIKDYNKWLDKLPKEWQLNPFHNHFIYVEPDATDIQDLTKAYLEEAYIKWATDSQIDCKNYGKTRHPVELIDAKRISDCEVKVESVKLITDSVRVM